MLYWGDSRIYKMERDVLVENFGSDESDCMTEMFLGSEFCTDLRAARKSEAV